MWTAKLQKVYGSYSEFKRYSETFKLHIRLGYKSPRSAWDHNPTVQGSTNPADYRVVKPRKTKRPTH